MTKSLTHLERLEGIFQAALDDRITPREAAEARLQLDVLKSAVVQHCRKANIDAEIWKNIES